MLICEYSLSVKMQRIYMQSDWMQKQQDLLFQMISQNQKAQELIKQGTYWRWDNELGGNWYEKHRKANRILQNRFRGNGAKGEANTVREEQTNAKETHSLPDTETVNMKNFTPA